MKISFTANLYRLWLIFDGFQKNNNICLSSENSIFDISAKVCVDLYVFQIVSEIFIFGSHSQLWSSPQGSIGEINLIKPMILSGNCLPLSNILWFSNQLPVVCLSFWLNSFFRQSPPREPQLKIWPKNKGLRNNLKRIQINIDFTTDIKYAVLWR